MGTIATKLEYLNNTKEKIRDSINLTGANIGTSDTFRSYASKLKKGYIDIINNGIDTLYNNFPKVSGIGSNLSLTPTYEAPMKLNEIQGDTLQDGTPTPNTPVPIQSVTGLQNINVCGKNLINMVETNKAVNNQGNISSSNIIYLGVEDYIPVQPNTTYTITFQHDIVVDGGIANLYIGRKDKDGNFIERTSYYTNRTFTTDANTYYIFPYLNKSGFEFTTIGGYVQLEKGSATEYEPYKGNTYEVNLGKNLFDKDNVNTINGYFTGSGTTTITGHNSHRIIYIPCNPNTTYTVQKLNEGSNKRFALATSETIPTINGTIMQSTGQQNNQDSLTITTNSTANYLLVWCYVTNDEQVTWEQILDSIQVEKGSQATSYSPYFTPIELNKIGDYQDRIYKNNGKWYLYKDFDKYTITGNEKISVFEVTSNGCFAVNLGIKCRNAVYSGSTTYWLATTLKPYSLENLRGSSPNIGICVLDDNYTYINLTAGASTLANVTTLFANLAGTDVYYLKQNPTTTEITNTELIEDLETLYTAKSQKGTTNISITSEDLEMILNVSALKGDVE